MEESSELMALLLIGLARVQWVSKGRRNAWVNGKDKVRLTLKTTRVFCVSVLNGFGGEGIFVMFMDYTGYTCQVANAVTAKLHIASSCVLNGFIR